MKKLFTSFVTAGTVASFAACGKKKADAKPADTKDTKTETKTTETKTTTTVVKGKVQSGTFKVGVAGSKISETLKGKELFDVVAMYSQDVKSPTATSEVHTIPDVKGTGDEYFNLPSGLFLKTSFDKWVQEEDGHKQLSDKTNLAAKNLDTIFVAVTDGKQNSSDVYKTVVEKKEFKDTKLFFVGEKAKAQEGASSKVFAGGNISTATFNDYAAAYIAGFQAAIGAIKYSGSEDAYEETTVSFLIGSTSESKDKKKAFAFRRGVEAAAAHSAYSKYLKVKFVSKTEDSSSSSKKLYREISEWKSREDSKSKLYEFSSADSFSDADRRIVYIAGATAKHWTGLSTYATALAGDGDDAAKFKRGKAHAGFWKEGDDTGLIGALYNYEKVTTSGKKGSDLTSKTFSRGVWVVLDKAATSSISATSAAKTDDSNVDALDRQGVATKLAGLTWFERHDVKFYGAIGKESKGTELYAKNALKGLYMGGPNYMIGKHTIFGAQLDLTHVNKPTGNDKDGTGLKREALKDVFAYGSVSKSIWASTTGKDSPGKAKDRFKKSLAHATAIEVTEAELTKSSPWLK